MKRGDARKRDNDITADQGVVALAQMLHIHTCTTTYTHYGSAKKCTSVARDLYSRGVRITPSPNNTQGRPE